MREILFRGFTPDENGKDRAFVNGEWIKGQWVQGSYLELNKTTYCIKEDYERDPGNTERYIVFDQMTDWGLPNRHLKADVLPETVGQYTGLTDKNGKRIFEGDYWIDKDNEYDIMVVEYRDGQFCFVAYGYCGAFMPYGYDETGGSFGEYDCISFAEYLDDEIGIIEVEVIGNIHDNPELLKGGVQE